MYIISVFRPETRGPYDGRTEDWEEWQRDPFEGYEVFAAFENEPDEKMLDKLQALGERYGWKFNIDSVDPDNPPAVLVL